MAVADFDGAESLSCKRSTSRVYRKADGELRIVISLSLLRKSQHRQPRLVKS
jgi:hypothetical protein